MARYIRRSIEPILQSAVKEFPAVVITGPRQSGKTTLLKHLFGDKFQYVSLEPPDIRVVAQTDPRGFLEHYSSPVILDEAQYAPELFFYIKEKIDGNRRQAGQYILTGSQNILLSEKISESLAGRAAILKLMPLSRKELIGHPNEGLPWQKSIKATKPRKSISSKILWESILRGSYPELCENQKRDRELWYASYVQTYLERDIRSLRHVGDLTQFQLFLRALAARSAQLIDISHLSRDLGVTVNTVKAWISVLEATYQIVIVRPYYANIGKRLVKTPKIYFTDVGMLCYLTGIHDIEHATKGPLSGAIMETVVFSEIFKTLLHQGKEPQIYFWRTSSGEEVDFLVFEGQRMVPIEVKLSSTPRTEMISSIVRLRTQLGESCDAGYLIHSGNIKLPLGHGVIALPFTEL
jgi:uncharacterized protein